MTLIAILLPMFAQVVLTFVLLFWMGYLRIQAIRSGQVDPTQVALREPNWPPRVLQIGNAFHNQLELPVLFYVLAILSIITHQADWIYCVLAWIFVLFRVLQAFVHVTNNNVRLRGAFYGVGALVLLAMWLIYIVRILLGLL